MLPSQLITYLQLHLVESWSPYQGAQYNQVLFAVIGCKGDQTRREELYFEDAFLNPDTNWFPFLFTSFIFSPIPERASSLSNSAKQSPQYHNMNLEPFTFVLERVGQLLLDEIKLLSTDKKQLLNGLQLQVELAQSFVRDVEEEKEHTTITHVLETEFQHIMRILPQIEDFLDTIHLEEEVQKSHSKPTFFQKFKACFSCTSNPLVHKHVALDTGAQLIKDLEDTRQRAVPYQRRSATPQTTGRRRPQPRTQPHVMNDEFIVGLEEDVKSLVFKLTGEDGEHTTILAISGMGGSGKTTLARKLYNHPKIKREFSVRAWVCVSQEWDTTQLLREVCKQAGLPIPQDSTPVPVGELQNLLLHSSYVVVIDDVWKREALQDLLPFLFPEGSSKGNGKVLVTARNEELLNYPALGGVQIHKARCLNEEESWELFSKIVRSKWQGIRSFDDETAFAKPGKEMLERCRGLPLAIVALAGLLSTKWTIQDWEILKNNVSSAITRQNKGFLDYGPVRYMLELSYSDLPYDLKPCFLYLGIYPEDSRIDVDDLIQLWIGEGLLKPNMCYEGQTLEELGMAVVDELVQRCMVQVVCRDYEEKVQEIQVHDLMRDLCMKKARESGFFDVASPAAVPSNTIDLKSRRAIIHDDGHSHPITNSHFRSVIKFSKFGKQTTKLEMSYESMRLLRVLDIVNVDLRSVEGQIGNLILLRHLRIWSCDGAMNLVLKSVKKLRNLVTFKFCSDDAGSVKVPNDMVGSMEHLRCLTLYVYKGAYYKFSSVLGVTRSRSLQSLVLASGEWLCKDLQAVSLIHSLRRLTLIDINTQTQLDAVSDFVGTPSNHLQALHLNTSATRLEFDLKRMNLEHCLQLKSLLLYGRIRKQEGPFFFPPNLLKLFLYASHVEKREELERVLAQLHQLRHLTLDSGSYDGDKLAMVGLPQLQSLTLSKLQNLKELRIEQGALCQLKYLKLCDCPKLERIPEGISGIHTLQHLEAKNMPLSISERLERPSGKKKGKRGGKDFHLIRHIPTVRIFCQL